MSGDDLEEERETYFDRAQGVAEDSFGQYWRWSSYGRGDLPAWHPAMLTRRRGRATSFGQDLVTGAVFLAIVIGIPAVAVFTSGGARLYALVWYAGAILFWLLLGAAYVRIRARNAELRGRHVPHPGPKGHHTRHRH